jgi:predicted protein tyrosine phosphatase
VINKILVQPVWDMEEKLRSADDFFSGTCVISCYPAAEELPDNDRWLRMFFADVLFRDEEHKRTFMASLDEESRQNLFNDKHAATILDFLMARQSEPQPLLLYVNCEIGVSRSGAVASFSREFLGLDEQAFRADNPRIAPNPHVLAILKQVARERK